MAISYFIKNNKIALSRFKVSYESYDQNYGTSTTVTANFDSQSEYLRYINGLGDIKYEVTTISEEEIEPYLQYEGIEVNSFDEAGKIINPDPKALLEYKIKQMNEACNATIVAGIDIELSDGTTEHFSLTTEDQLNMLGLTIEAASGVYNASGVPYHADGCNCKIYTLADFNMISAKASAFKKYHTTYVNQIKAYLKDLAADGSTLEMHVATYGMELPTKYTDELENIINTVSATALL